MRSRWTDDLIDQRMAGMDEKFDRLFAEVHVLRQEMRAGFSELRREVVASHRQVMWIVGSLAVGLLGLLGVGQL
jgi:hypothetical protein